MNKDLLHAIDIVLAWWEKHKDDTYYYSRDGYGYEGETFDSDDAAVFDKLRDERGKYEKSS